LKQPSRHVVARVALLALLFAGVAIADRAGSDIFPQDISAMFQLKGGYTDDRMAEEGFFFGSVRADLRLKPTRPGFLKGGYSQSQFPISVYWLDPGNLDAVAVDARYRLEIGPPSARWVPLFFPEVGYFYMTESWYTSEQPGGTHTGLVGGMVRFPLGTNANSSVEVSAQFGVVGQKMTRISCYFQWFCSEHFGFTLHGDAFPSRDTDKPDQRYGGIVAGVVYK